MSLRRGSQRRSQHSSQGLPLGRFKSIQPKPDFASVAKVKAAEQQVPVGKNGPVVGVGLGPPAAVVDAVHRRGDDQGQQAVVQPARKPHVGVLEEHHWQEHGLVDGHVADGNAEERQDGKPGDGRKNNFPRVEPYPGRHVHVGVAVVHPVESPQEKNAVVRAMPDIHP